MTLARILGDALRRHPVTRTAAVALATSLAAVQAAPNDPWFAVSLRVSSLALPVACLCESAWQSSSVRSAAATVWGLAAQAGRAAWLVLRAGGRRSGPRSSAIGGWGGFVYVAIFKLFALAVLVLAVLLTSFNYAAAGDLSRLLLDLCPVALIALGLHWVRGFARIQTALLRRATPQGLGRVLLRPVRWP